MLKKVAKTPKTIIVGRQKKVKIRGFPGKKREQRLAIFSYAFVCTKIS